MMNSLALDFQNEDVMPTRGFKRKAPPMGRNDFIYTSDTELAQLDTDAQIARLKKMPPMFECVTSVETPHYGPMENTAMVRKRNKQDIRNLMSINRIRKREAKRIEDEITRLTAMSGTDCYCIGNTPALNVFANTCVSGVGGLPDPNCFIPDVPDSTETLAVEQNEMSVFESDMMDCDTDDGL